QGIKVTGSIPVSETGKLYKLQVGAYRLPRNAGNAAAALKRLGFNPGSEQCGSLIRVFIDRVRASQVRSFVDRLANAGFREVIIREAGPAVPRDRERLSAASGPAVPMPGTDNAGSGSAAVSASGPAAAGVPAVDVPAEPMGPVKIDLSRRTELLCRSWRSLTLNGENIRGTGPDNIITFSADGTYSITYLDNHRSDEGLWEWKDDESADVLYTWDNWKSSAVDKILELTETRLKDQWGVENLEEPQVWVSEPHHSIP
ncbi:MAG: SPOR domain-containing protein, partial [Spirochaetaceae bacterium]|nr:SPOR domain-containing protein [Spirochaetaceae bacterium]